MPKFMDRRVFRFTIIFCIILISWFTFTTNIFEFHNSMDTMEMYPSNTTDRIVPFAWCYADSNRIVHRSWNDPNCDQLFAGNYWAVRKARYWKPECSYNDERMLDIACECQQLKRLFHFEHKPLSQEEADYPLAFILVVEKFAEQVVRLLASIYQPQNFYCLTYDHHSNENFKASVRCLTKCFPNVIMPNKHFEIFWGDISILDATMSCMKLMIDSGRDWKYVQILSWNDLPLKSNAEMVKIFKIFNGAADIDLMYGQTDRFRIHHFQGHVDASKANVPRPIPPGGVTVYKSSFAVSLPRSLCNYMVNDESAREILDWSRPMLAAEEQFWSTIVHNMHLNHNSTFPGTCLHYYELEKREKKWVSRFQIWESANCTGRMPSSSCLYGVGDLRKMKSRKELIAHKFYADFQPAAWYCMLKWHHEKTYGWSVSNLDTNYYENMESVLYHRMTNKSGYTC